jgi:predicted  nucleic acid-binding Zn-ribbon protein
MEGREQIQLLKELQGLQTELTVLNKRLKKNQDAKAQIQEVLTNNQADLSEGTEALEVLKKSYREMESDTRIANDNVRKLNAKLNMVKTNKEYHALLKEIEEIKRDVSSMEDRMLVQLDELSAKEEVLKAQTELLTQTEKKSTKDCIEIDQDDSECQKRLEALNQARQELLDKLPAGLRTTYGRVVRNQSNGLAVAPVVNSVCGGCNVNIPPQMYNELQRCDTVQLCPSCQRIIFWPTCCDD